MLGLKLALYNVASVATWEYAKFLGWFEAPNIGHGWLFIWIALGFVYCATPPLALRPRRS